MVNAPGLEKRGGKTTPVGVGAFLNAKALAVGGDVA
jgi:hypothetical protein